MKVSVKENKMQLTDIVLQDIKTAPLSKTGNSRLLNNEGWIVTEQGLKLHLLVISPIRLKV